MHHNSFIEHAIGCIPDSYISNPYDHSLTIVGQKLEKNSTAKQLWIALYFPSLPILATGQSHNNQPTAVYEKIGSNSFLIYTNLAAQRIGIKPSMHPSELSAFRPDIQILKRDLKKEQFIIKKLASLANSWSPTVMIADNSILLLEIGSTLRLHNGLTSLTRKIEYSIPNELEGYHIAITPTLESAKLCVKYNTYTYLINYTQLIYYIRDISVDKIILPDRQCKLLSGLGIKTIGDLFRLQRNGISQRFGIEFLNYIDRLTGKIIDPKPFSKSRPFFYANLDLEGELSTIQQLSSGIRNLLIKLEQYLDKSYAATNQLDWYFYYENNCYETIPIRLNQLQRKFVSLYRISELSLNSLSLSNVVIRIALYARPQAISQLDNTQFLITANKAKKHEFIDRLCARIGNYAINGIRCNTAHKPESAWAYCAPGSDSYSFSVGVRPFLIFKIPRLLITKDRKPYFHGPLKLSKCERIVTSWWEQCPIKRDYYVASSNRGQLWIFRDIDTKSWYIHGRF